jgi:hypothetical protein
VNPKDKVGSRKVGLNVVPPSVILAVSNALAEGAIKYNPYNWREDGVVGSEYYNACFRHLSQYWEGEDIDDKSNTHHIVKAIATLIVWYDSIQQGNAIDDRPKPHINQNWIEDLNTRKDWIVDNVKRSDANAD